MANNTAPSGFSGIVHGALVNKDGTASPAALQLFRDWNTRLTKGLNLLGQFIGVINFTTIITERGGTIGTALQNVDSEGVVTADGVDFSRAYLNKDTDHITDGTGSPLAGGKTAYAALVASAPADGKSLVFNAGEWNPANVAYADITGTPTLPAAAPVTPSRWVNSYDPATGIFTETQPGFSDLSGTATAAQVPALSALSGTISTGQLPAGGFTGTVALAKLTTGGANGSLTITNGLITGVVNPT